MTIFNKSIELLLRRVYIRVVSFYSVCRHASRLFSGRESVPSRAFLAFQNILRYRSFGNINKEEIMARVQVYVSDEVSEKIRVIAEKRRAEGARDKDVSFSSIASMLVELGLRVYEAQMERKESSFNQALYNKTILENVMKTQFIVSKLLAMESLSPHLAGNEKFDFRDMVTCIREDVQQIVEKFFPQEEESQDN